MNRSLRRRPTVAILTSITLACATTMTALPAQNRSLADAAYYMKDVERQAPDLIKRSANAAALSPNDRKQLLTQIGWAGDKLQKVFDRLAGVPANDPKAVTLRKQAETRSAELMKAIESIQKAHQAAEAAAAAAKETIAADHKQLAGLSAQVNQDRLLQSHPHEAIETVRSLPKMIEFRNEIEKKYAAVLGQPLGRDLKAAIDGFDYGLGKYREAMSEHANGLPSQVRSDLDTASSIAELGIQRKSAGPFTAGGIQQAFGRATIGIDMLEAIAGKSAESSKLREECKAVEQRIREAQQQLSAEIVAANRAPSDIYRGGDRDEVLALAKKHWGKQAAGRGRKLLGMRIPMHGWERHDSWRFALDRFKKESLSQLQVAILVEASKNEVHVYYAHLEKDHFAGDRIKVTVDSKGDVPLYRRVLRSNLD